MPTVTGLRETRGGRVAVELDGAEWRTLPIDVVARTQIGVGEELDRTRLRELARELRRARALDAGLRALARSDLSAAALRRRLEGRRVRPPDRDEAVAKLERAGLVDDERFARRRAESLAERGHGDAAIRWRLEREVERAARIVAARGAGPKTAMELARRGFGEEALELASGSSVADWT